MAERRRPLWTVVGLLVAAAVVLWVGSLRGGGAAQSALAVLALAMIAAVLATGGLARRGLGVLAAVAGVIAGVAARGVEPVPAVLGVAAGLSLLGAGVLLAARGHRMPRMGSRYRTSPAPRDRTLWDELDAGRDPTN